VSAPGKFLVDAKDLVFHELPSVVKKNGKPVQWWVGPELHGEFL